MGAADPEAVNSADQTPWHVVQRMHKPANLKKWEKVVFKGQKPDGFDDAKQAQLRPRGKYARAAGLEPTLQEDTSKPLPVCLLFPGQGTQFVGMLRSLKDLPAVRQMLETAKKVLGYDLEDIMLNGPAEKLAQTKFCQPAMYVANLAALEKLKLEEPDKVERCQAVAGLSLGEYSALAAAGVFDFETGLRVVKARAEAMDFEISGVRPGAKAQAMCLVVGLARDEVEKLCKSCAGKGETCQVASCLFSRGFAVGGSLSAVETFESKAKDTALQCNILSLSGAFHTQEMADVRGILVKELEAVKSSLRSPRCNVYPNSSSVAVGPNASVQDIIKLLADQMVSPVLWEQSMQQAIKDGCTEFYEIGPGCQLTGIMKRIDGKVADKMSSIPA